MLAIGLIVVCVVLGIWVHVLQARYYATQYLFFLRYPLLVGLLLVALPWVGPLIAPNSLRNIFVQGPVGAFTVAFVACLLGWVVVYTGRLIWVSVPERAGLVLSREVNQAQEDAAAHLKAKVPIPEKTRKILAEYQPKIPPALLDGGWFWVGPALAVPLAIKILLATEESVLLIACMVGLGLLLAGALRWAAGSRGPKRSKDETVGGEARKVPRPGFIGRMASRSTRWSRDRGEDEPAFRFHLRRLVGLPGEAFADVSPEVQAFHRRATYYCLTTTVVYLAIGVLTFPGFRFAGEFPALVYLLLLLMVGAWVLGFLSYLFDKTRLPGVAILVLVLLGWQAVWPSTHVYVHRAWSGSDPGVSVDEHLASWTAKRRDRTGDDDPPLVAIGASGGGISAALWTAQVLSGLERHIPGFRDTTALVSTVSGGGVGAMYWNDAAPSGETDPRRFEAAVDRAGASSLAAATWGLAYLDLARLVAGRTLGRFDRGWAQEQRWKQLLSGDVPTIAAWSKEVLACERPAQVFNVTLQETGGRMLMAPFSLARGIGTEDTFSLAEAGMDLPVTTAARLSATFPYISPQARPSPEVRHGYHAADGGYYDNSGLVTVLEILDGYLNTKNPTHRIAILEIRADVPVDRREEPDVAGGGLLNTLFGPVETLYNVRSASQVGRNQFEVRLALKQWADRAQVDVRHFQFHLSEGQVLSWHLTESEKAAILGHWPSDQDVDRERSRMENGLPLDPVDAEEPYSPDDARRHNARQVAELQAFLQG